MRSTFKVPFYLKRDKQKKDGSVPLFCRITIDDKEVHFGMKQVKKEKEFDTVAFFRTAKEKMAKATAKMTLEEKKNYWKLMREVEIKLS